MKRQYASSAARWSRCSGVTAAVEPRNFRFSHSSTGFPPSRYRRGAPLLRPVALADDRASAIGGAGFAISGSGPGSSAG